MENIQFWKYQKYPISYIFALENIGYISDIYRTNPGGHTMLGGGIINTQHEPEKSYHFYFNDHLDGKYGITLSLFCSEIGCRKAEIKHITFL